MDLTLAAGAVMGAGALGILAVQALGRRPRSCPFCGRKYQLGAYGRTYGYDGRYWKDSHTIACERAQRRLRAGKDR